MLALAFAGLAVGAPLATAQEADDAKAIILTIDKTKTSSGQLMFTIEPEGFVYKKVPYAGGKNVSGTGQHTSTPKRTVPRRPSTSAGPARA